VSPPHPVIELAGLGRTFPGHPPIVGLRPTNLAIWPGELVTIVGPSGSGKSTLLNLLGLLDRPTEGTYLLDGVDVFAMRENQRASTRGARIGFVFQAFQLMMERTSSENVQMATLYEGAPKTAAVEAAVQGLSAVGLFGKADVKVSLLSGGEQQRVAIARALAGRPSVLLCDEPTGNLDTANSAAILELFVELNRGGATVVLITHDERIAQIGTRQFSIRDGLLSESVGVR
jgi:putative ABC transport system ATP-binding protein